MVKRQIGWIDWRNAAKSRTGLLRRAIEGDWPKPKAVAGKEIRNPDSLSKWTNKEETLHYEQHRPAYQTWLATEEARYRQEFSDEYARFQAKRARARADIRVSPSGNLRVHLLTYHDDVTGRLTDFQKFMGLPDFWQWDAQFNDTPFNQADSQS